MQQLACITKRIFNLIDTKNLYYLLISRVLKINDDDDDDDDTQWLEYKRMYRFQSGFSGLKFHSLCTHYIAQQYTAFSAFIC